MADKKKDPRNVPLGSGLAAIAARIAAGRSGQIDRAVEQAQGRPPVPTVPKPKRR